MGKVPDSELTARLRLKVIETIDSVACAMAMKAMAKLDERMKTASYLELISAADILIKGAIER